MGGAVFLVCCLTWDHTMVEVMKKIVTPSKDPAHTLLHSVPRPCSRPPVGPCLHLRFPDTQRQAWVSLLWGHCSSLLGPGAHKVLFVPSKNLFPQSCISSGGSRVGLMVTSFKTAYATPRSAAPRAPAPATGYCWPVPPLETLKHSKTGLPQALWGLLVCTRICLSPLSISDGYQVWVWWGVCNFLGSVLLRQRFEMEDQNVTAWLQPSFIWQAKKSIPLRHDGRPTPNREAKFILLPSFFFVHLEKCCTQYASKLGKLSSGHRTGKGQLIFQSQTKAMPKNVQTTTHLHSSHMVAK